MDYTRRSNIISEVESKKAQHFDSINAAKRESRRLQKEGHKVTVIRK